MRGRRQGDMFIAVYNVQFHIVQIPHSSKKAKEYFMYLRKRFWYLGKTLRITLHLRL